jgi:hypothetical protein
LEAEWAILDYRQDQIAKWALDSGWILEFVGKPKAKISTTSKALEMFWPLFHALLTPPIFQTVAVYECDRKYYHADRNESKLSYLC